MKKKSLGLSKIIYTEWLQPILHYYLTIKKNEAMFEIVIPVFISVVCSGIYNSFGKVEKALSAMAFLLPTAISILIGFTIMLITLLLTSGGESVDKIKKIALDKKLNKRPITLFQGLHIQFSHSLSSEIILLLIVFFYMFLNGVGWIGKAGIGFLFIESYLILNILLSILRGIANLYFSFYNS